MKPPPIRQKEVEMPIRLYILSYINLSLIKFIGELITTQRGHKLVETLHSERIWNITLAKQIALYSRLCMYLMSNLRNFNMNVLNLTERLIFGVSEEFKKQIVKSAKQSEISIAAFCRTAIREKIANSIRL